jgi:cysteine desulfurase
MYVYADNAATTAVSKTALDAMMPMLTDCGGNPSSLHSVGQRAAEKLSASRDIFAKYLNARPGEITFTSGGSEADNQAISPRSDTEPSRAKSTSSPRNLNTTRCCTA